MKALTTFSEYIAGCLVIMVTLVSMTIGAIVGLLEVPKYIKHTSK